MKYLLALIMTCMTLMSFGQTSIAKLSWLEGTWVRTNAKAGRSGTEVWTKISGTLLKGTGTTKIKDEIVVEKIEILVKDQELFYVADIPENNGKVYFRITSITADGFVCENPEHDFPKKIVYTRNGDNLKATISGDGKSIDYLFERKK